MRIHKYTHMGLFIEMIFSGFLCRELLCFRRGGVLLWVWRNREKVYLLQIEDYGEKFGESDVIGCYIVRAILTYILESVKSVSLLQNLVKTFSVDCKIKVQSHLPLLEISHTKSSHEEVCLIDFSGG